MALRLEMQARGYISSRQFRGQRVPQHIQNIVIRKYCEDRGLQYVLARAEYNFNNRYNQLWAGLEEGMKNIVFYSICQLPECTESRKDIYDKCRVNGITLHFATELEMFNASSASKIEETIRIIDAIRHSSQISRKDLLYIRT